MMPKGPGKLALSNMHMLGMGTAMMKYVMKRKRVDSLPDLMAMARRAGVRLVACTMSMEVMGIKKEDLRLDLIEEFGAVGTYVNEAKDSKITLFI